MSTRIGVGVTAAAVLFVACGSDAGSRPDPVTTEATEPAAGPLVDDYARSDLDEPTSQEAVDSSGPFVTIGDTELGPVLADAEGFTLYGFIDDVDGLPTCEGGCADAWPPLLVPSGELPDELDPTIFSVVLRYDDSPQLAAGSQPLYRFAGDKAAGDTRGQGSGGTWFVVSPVGELVGVGDVVIERRRGY